MKNGSGKTSRTSRTSTESSSEAKSLNLTRYNKSMKIDRTYLLYRNGHGFVSMDGYADEVTGARQFADLLAAETERNRLYGEKKNEKTGTISILEWL